LLSPPSFSLPPSCSPPSIVRLHPDTVHIPAVRLRPIRLRTIRICADRLPPAPWISKPSVSVQSSPNLPFDNERFASTLPGYIQAEQRYGRVILIYSKFIYLFLVSLKRMKPLFRDFFLLKRQNTKTKKIKTKWTKSTKNKI
jgi:hypothetical protein